MNRLVFIVCMVTVIAVNSCTSSKDVLAVYSEGGIERGELKGWASARNISRDVLATDAPARESMLRQIALEKIILGLAVQSGFDKDDEYRMVRDVVYSNFLSSYYFSRYFRKVSFSRQSVNVSIIRLFFNGAPGGSDYKKKYELIAGVIIPALKTGSPFEELARQYSMDSAKTKGGSLGFILPEMLDKEMLDIVTGLKDGTFSEAPVRIGNSLCVVTVKSRQVITGENINSIVSDRANRDRILSIVRKGEIASTTLKLETADGVLSNLKKARFRTDNELLFSIKGKEYRLAHVKKVLGMFYLLKNNVVRTDFPDNEIKDTAERMFREGIASAEAERLNYHQDKDFAERWKYLERATLTGMYKTRYITGMVTVSSEDVEAAMKMPRKEGGLRTKGTAPSREDVYAGLYRSAFRVCKNRWESSLLQESGFALK